ncbi:hypothetical protein Y1Q_0022055 [Alligator mississippiensis]|uniref:Uncharacterized protein n=1 Tax=Alligator mississippiensis TaxID=8496 RepID=A0A151NLT1_ALLMI|nr:hypothetical protein Y1Q_0022055 [Alligator mississippiensis]
MTLLCVPWTVCDELFVQAVGYLCRYALLMMILLVLWAYLHSWFGTLSYDGMGSKPSSPCRSSQFIHKWDPEKEQSRRYLKNNFRKKIPQQRSKNMMSTSSPNHCQSA